MMHALKGTDFTLDLDYEKVLAASEVFEDAMKDYFFPPEAKMVSPTVTSRRAPPGSSSSIRHSVIAVMT